MPENINDNGPFTEDTRPPGTWGKRKVRIVDGQEIVESSEGYSPDNPAVNVSSVNYKTAADGRERPCS